MPRHRKTTEDVSKISQYHEIDMNVEQRMAGMAGMAVEMKVNQKSRSKVGKTKFNQQYREIKPHTPERVVSAEKMRTMPVSTPPNITEVPNKNQEKSYNKKYEFFTKPLGPGHYDAKVKLTKPQSSGSNWHAMKEQRSKSIGPAHNANVPGPGDYEVKNE